jgi:hypothetical protein
MCPIVNHVWIFFTKIMYFYGNIMDKYMFSYHFFKNDQISILLLLLCGNLEKE